MKAQHLVESDEVQPAVRVDDWPNPPRPFKTVMLYTDNFVGVIEIQASLYLNPSDDDWFDISTTAYVPVVQGNERFRNSTFNSRDRYIWMRAVVTKVSGRVDRIMVL